MMKFSYKAKKGPKEIVEGILEGENQRQIVDKLTGMGYVPIRIVPAEKASSEKAPALQIHIKEAKGISGLKLFRRVRAKEVTIFTEQLTSLVKSKVPLLEVMNVLSEQTENLYLKDIILHIRNEIKDGATLAQSLSKYPGVFPPLYINMVDSGEKGGVLEDTLVRLSDFRNREEEVKAKVSSALAYPIFIVIVGLITVFVLLGLIIPRIASLFEQIGQTLPLPTRLLIFLSNKIKNYWFLAVIVVALTTFIVRKSGIVKEKKVGWDRLKLKLPLLGNFIKKRILARFSRTLSTLLANGVPLFQAIKITIPTLDSEVFKLELEKVYKNIIDGASLEGSMKKSFLFPSFMINMLAVGEKRGSLKEALSEIANFYEREIDKISKVITSLLEPAIILVMGLIVGFVVFAMLLPIFQMNMGM